MSVSNRVKEAILGTWLEPIQQWGIESVLDRTIIAANHQYSIKTVFPAKSKIFRALLECEYDDVSVVFIGQDPYHDGKATGICFANDTPDEPRDLSPSLRVLKEEWEEDSPTQAFDPSLLTWAHQGILMLNTALTVEQGEPKSHSDIWKNWTSVFLSKLSKEKPDLLYVMFGKKAQEWKSHITHGHTLAVVHPAAEVYSNGAARFFGSKPFSKVNQQLVKLERPIIVW